MDMMAHSAMQGITSSSTVQDYNSPSTGHAVIDAGASVEGLL